MCERTSAGIFRPKTFSLCCFSISGKVRQLKEAVAKITSFLHLIGLITNEHLAQVRHQKALPTTSWGVPAPFFAHPFFLFSLVCPTPPQAIFFSQNPPPLFLEPQNFPFSRRKATCRGWVLGGVWKGSTHRKKI